VRFQGQAQSRGLKYLRQRQLRFINITLRIGEPSSKEGISSGNFASYSRPESCDRSGRP
jgi:hypothetical protein